MSDNLKKVKPPRIILIKTAYDEPVEATIDFVREDIGYYVATVPGNEPIAMRRVWLPIKSENKSWYYKGKLDG